MDKEKIKQRFWSKVDKSSSCWVWKGSYRPNGYGYLDIYLGRKDGKSSYLKISAHRLSWEIANGAAPQDKHVCHTCDNKSCVNPAHLFLGSHDDNMKDKVSKGRHIFGELHKEAKLTDEVVSEARARYATGKVGMRTLAKEYGVSRSTLRDAIKGKKWKHVI